MARKTRQPYFRTALYPIEERWVAGPGFVVAVPRFVLTASVGPVGQPEAIFRGNTPLVQPEIPYSVLPYSQRDLATLEPPEAWRGRPVPPWRGIPCRFGKVAMRVSNQVDSAEPMTTFTVLVLVSDREAPGPPQTNVQLGAEFFRHYAFRVHYSYEDFAYTGEGAARKLDSSVPCGYLEKD